MVKITKIDKQSIVRKSNSLNTKRYSLSLKAQKILLMIYGLVGKQDKKFKIYNLETNVIRECLQIKKSGRTTRQIKNSILELFRKEVEFKPEKYTNFLSYADLSKPSLFKFQIAEQLKPFILQLGDNYIQYQLKNVIKLKTVYSIKLYELLKCRQELKTITYSIEQLRKCLNIPKSYTWQSIKDQIIKKAQKDFKGITDIQFNFEPVQNGKKYIAVKFNLYTDHEVLKKSYIHSGNKTEIKSITLKQQTLPWPSPGKQKQIIPKSNKIQSVKSSKPVASIINIEDHKLLTAKNKQLQKRNTSYNTPGRFKKRKSNKYLKRN